MPCTMGNQPSTTTVRISAASHGAFQRRTLSQSTTLAAASPTKSQRKPIRTASKGSSTLGASRKTT